MSRSRSSLPWGLGCLALLAATGPGTATLLRVVSQPLHWAVTTPADVAVAEVAALGAWICLTWTLGGALLLVAGRLPGITGRLAAATTHRVLPAALRGALETTLGLTLAVSAVGVPAGSALAQEVPVATSTATATATPSSAATAAGSATAGSATTIDGGPFDRPAGPARGAIPSASPAPRKPVRHTAPARRPGQSSSDVVVVAPGDSLWRIAAVALGADPTDAAVDRSWRQWHATNAAVIGGNPHLIHPGQRLRPPAAP